MSLIADKYVIDEVNAKLLKAWLTAGKWSIDQATLLFLDIDPDSTYGDCFTTFSGHGSIRYDYYDDDDPGSQMSYGFDDDGEPDYLTSEQRSLLKEIRKKFKETERKINLLESAKPHEWIDLSLEKGVVIPWLTWATQQNLYAGKEAPAKQLGKAPRLEVLAPIWKTMAVKRAIEIIERDRARDLYPSQTDIADQIATEFREAKVMGNGGKPLTGAYIKRHALKGVSSEQGKQRSTSIR